MQEMIKKFRSNPNISYFVAYCLSFIGFGMLIAGMGPVIPFLSVKFNIVETQFKLFFFCRAVGFVLGAISSKFTHLFMDYHHQIIIGSLGSGLPFILFAFSDSYFMCGIYAFFASYFACILEISMVLSIIALNKGRQEDFWLQIAYGFMGLGALVIPLLIQSFAEKGLIFITINSSIVIPFYFYKKSPQLKKEQELSVQILEGNNDQKQKQDLQLMTYSQQLMLGLILFIYSGIEIGFSGWVSSYTVLLGVQNKQQAAVLNSIFWISLTFFRFTLPMFMKGSPYHKFYTLIKFQSVSLIFCIACQNLGFIQFGAYVASLVLGFALSAMCPLILALPIHFKKQLSHQVSSNLLILGVFGEGIIATFIGQAMNRFGTKTFYISILAFVIIKLIILISLVNRWIKQKDIKLQAQIEKQLQDL